MQKIKDEKGITLSVLIITIVVMSLLSVPVIVNLPNISSRQNYEDFCNDITKLGESISQVYDLNADFSTSDGYIGPKFSGDLTFLNNSQDGANVKNPNDGDLYYVIDAVNLNKKLNNYNISLGNLQYGENYNVSSSSTITSGKYYIINAKSRTIYYPEGIQYDGQTYYRYPGSFVNVKVSK